MTIEQVERQKLTEEETEERDQLLSQGFGDWKRRDLLVRTGIVATLLHICSCHLFGELVSNLEIGFKITTAVAVRWQNFVAGCAEHGWRNITAIAAGIEGKSVAEVRRYSATFWYDQCFTITLVRQSRLICHLPNGIMGVCNRERGPDELQDWEKHKQKIEEGERKREKLQDMVLAISMKCKQYERFEHSFSSLSFLSGTPTGILPVLTCAALNAATAGMMLLCSRWTWMVCCPLLRHEYLENRPIVFYCGLQRGLVRTHIA
eukprot:COSAG02_NODE_464_length_21824_cov_80.221082_5_plen_262_part_00